MAEHPRLVRRSVTRDWGVVVGLLPVLRAFLAMVIIVRWLTSDNKMRRMLVAYVFTVVIFTYISGLVFFEYEAGVNPKLHGFGNALWWAWMNVTTVGGRDFSPSLPSARSSASCCRRWA